MAINPPVDATKTPEWAALQKHYDELQSEGISLKPVSYTHLDVYKRQAGRICWSAT